MISRGARFINQTLGLRINLQRNSGVSLPSESRVVVCGGGVIGCSVAYHLGKLGWSDVVLLEQGRYVSQPIPFAALSMQRVRPTVCAASMTTS